MPLISSFFYFLSACVVYGLSCVLHSISTMTAMREDGGGSLPLFVAGMIESETPCHDECEVVCKNMQFGMQIYTVNTD